MAIRMTQHARIVITRRLPAATIARMHALFPALDYHDSDTPLAANALRARVQGCRILVCTLGDSVDAATIDALTPTCGLIANFGAGVDHIDVAYAKAQKIRVSNTPSVLTEDTADVTLALLLAVPRRLGEAAQAIRQNTWQGWNPTYMLGHRVAGKTLGIVGLGRIGQAVARRARGFGLHVQYYQRQRLHETVEKELGVTYVPSLDAMLPSLDFLTLHCPHTSETHHLMNAQRLALMKPTAYLINTARGALLDESALIEALEAGRIAGAGLDVFEHAPAVPEALKALPNVVLLPHISSATLESRHEMGERVIINIQSFLDGHQPPDRVLLEEVS